MNFSLEIGPKTDLETIPSVNDVYITMLPGGDYKDTAYQAVELVKRGFNPVPHFPARSMLNENDLKDYVNRCKDGGVKQALVIGGGREPAVSVKLVIIDSLYSGISNKLKAVITWRSGNKYFCIINSHTILCRLYNCISFGMSSPNTVAVNHFTPSVSTMRQPFYTSIISC